MITDWYKARNYQFLVLSDHNILSCGERWMKVTEVERRTKGVGEPALGKYLARFGDEWVDLRGEGDAQEVRLKIWDIANTLRLAELGGELIYGIASDDSHNYHGGNVMPGRGWIMVHAEKLVADTLVHSMKAGDFYGSTGVTLESVNFDPKTNVLEIRIAGSDETDGRVTTKIHGTLRGEEGDPAKVGKELATYDTRVICHQLTGKEWFVRATVTSGQDHLRPSFPGQKQKAWTQPVRPSAN